MCIVFRNCVILFALCLLTSCQYLSDATPTCSDKATLDLVRQIIGEATLDGTTMPSAETLQKRLTFDYPRATKLEENIRKYSCEAHLIVIGELQKHKIELTYISQIDDSGNHLVEVSGMTVMDAAIIKAALSLPHQKAVESLQQESTVESPSDMGNEEASIEPLEQIENSSAELQPEQAPNEALAQETEGNPKFRDYPAEHYVGPTAKLLLNSEFAKQYRTRLREALTDTPVFAGEYVSTSWGCGTDTCTVTAFVSKRTGKTLGRNFETYTMPNEADESGESLILMGEEIVSFNLDSRLLETKEAYTDNQTGRLTNFINYYIVENDELKRIKRTPYASPTILN